MLLTTGSALIALAVLVSTYLLTHGHTRAGCWYTIAIQPPACAYDIGTRQYGFLLIAVVSIATCWHALRR